MIYTTYMRKEKSMTFNVNAYVSELNPNKDDQVLNEFEKLFNTTQIILDDAYSCRAYFWGVASAMENQLQYLGGNYLPNLERRLNQVDGNGFLSENDLSVSWYTNEDKPHVNEEEPLDDQAIDIKNQIDRITDRMHTLGIAYVLARSSHDDISKDLNQLTYGAIKSRASAKKKAVA
mgnify:FL=1